MTIEAILSLGKIPMSVLGKVEGMIGVGVGGLEIAPLSGLPHRGLIANLPVMDQRKDRAGARETEK